MKKGLNLLVLALTAFILTFTLAACDSDDEPKGCTSHNFGDNYDITDDGHVYHCTNAGCKATRTDSHHFGSTNVVTPSTCTVAGVGEKICVVCEYSYKLPLDTAAHIYEKDYRNDETNHWRKCQNCEARISTEAHKYVEHGHDSDSHWFTCECGAKGNLSAHTWDKQSNDNGTMTLTCTEPTCRYKLENVADPDHVHDWSDGDIITPATCTATGKQAQICVCGTVGEKTLDKIPHKFNHGEYFTDSTHHWQNCECTVQPGVADKIPHNFDVEPTEEGDFYVYTCVCGEQKKEHKPGYIDPDGWTKPKN